MKLRNIGKMAIPNNGNRTLFESILNRNSLSILKSIQFNFDFIIINDISIGFHHKPYMSKTIDILVKNKKEVDFKFSEIGIRLFDTNDFGFNLDIYHKIEGDCFYSDGSKVISPTYMILLLLKNDYLSIDNRFYISKLIYNSKIDLNIISQYFKIDDLLKFIQKNNKDYMLKYLKNYQQYNSCFIYEGSSGYAEVDAAFEDWINNTYDKNQVLIGGMALVNYDIDRSTQDVDFLFLSSDEIPEQVNGFKKYRGNAFQHNKTHVEIEVLTNKSINLDPTIVDLIFKTAYQKEKFKIASPSGLVAIKLDRFSPSDERDISLLMKNYSIDIDEFLPHLSDRANKNWKSIIGF